MRPAGVTGVGSNEEELGLSCDLVLLCVGVPSREEPLFVIELVSMLLLLLSSSLGESAVRRFFTRGPTNTLSVFLLLSSKSSLQVLSLLSL